MNLESSGVAPPNKEIDELRKAVTEIAKTQAASENRVNDLDKNVDNVLGELKSSQLTQESAMSELLSMMKRAYDCS